MSNEEEIGTLIVVVLKARNLNDKHFYKQDVYAQIALNGVSKRTRIDVKGGQHPLWDEEIRFPVMKSTASKFRQLEASCWAKEHKDDTLLGEAKIDMTQTIKTGEFDEWIPLETNGVARGEIYLEITYYSNAPAPVNLAAPANLARRPSKLSPADRMSRPPVTPPKTYANLEPSHQQQGPRTPPKNPTSLPESLTPAVPSNLRPGPAMVAPRQQVPPTTQSSRPSGVSSIQQQVPPAAQPSRLPGVPSILRPGNPQSDSNHTHHTRTHSASSSSSPPYFGNTPSPGQVPYNPVSGQSTFVNAHSRSSSSSPIPPQGPGYHPTPGQGPNNSGGPTPPVNPGYNSVSTYAFNNPSVSADSWDSQPKADDGITLSFPVLSVSGLPGGIAAPPASYGSSYYTRPYPPGPAPIYSRASSYTQRQPADFSSSGSDLPDPYLIARYQTPLPLPQGAELTHAPHTQPSVPVHYSRTPSQELPSLPVPQVADQPPRSYTPIDESRLRVLRQAEEEAARRKAQEERDLELARQLDQELERESTIAASPHPPVPPPKSASPPLRPRVVESDAAAQRRAQEEKDLELARQLDLELNLNASSTVPNRTSVQARAGMPGGW